MNSPPDNDEPFLARWSRRKRAEAELATPATQPSGADSTDRSEATAAPAIGDKASEDKLDLSTLPRVEEIDERTDITAFLDRRVPVALRNAALGRMWTLDPTIRDFIEVAENQWNWNVPGGAPFYEPMQGGMEMAEQIVQGLGSTIRSVAEAADPSSAGSTLVEDGHPTSAADETLANAASQHGNSEVGPSEAGSMAPNTLDVGDTTHAADNVVLQHEPSVSNQPQRRHGGALPT